MALTQAEWAALKAAQDAGYTQQDLLDAKAAQEQQALIDYLRAVDAANKAAATEPVVQEPVKDASLGGTTNEEYIAAKEAIKAKAEREASGEADFIHYYDLNGDKVWGPAPKYGAYDDEYQAFRESATDPIPDSRYLENAWGFDSPKYNYETGEYESNGIVWNGPGPAPDNGAGIGDLLKGSMLEGADYTQNAEGGWNIVPGTGGLVDRPPVADEDRELTLGGNYPSGEGGSQGNPPDVPGENFPYVPSTGSDGVSFGKPPIDREWGKYMPKDYQQIDHSPSYSNPNQEGGLGNTGKPSLDTSADYDWQGAAADLLRYAKPTSAGRGGEGDVMYGSDVGSGNMQGYGQSGQGPTALGRGMGQLGVFTGGPSGSYGGGSVWNAVKAAAGD